jgi:hypothetical protein
MQGRADRSGPLHFERDTPVAFIFSKKYEPFFPALWLSFVWRRISQVTIGLTEKKPRQLPR